jgi:hypothetical protein
MIKMILFLSIFMVIPLELWAQDYENCCICVADNYDSVEVGKECQKWFSLKDQKSCDYKKTQTDKDSPFFDAGVSCRNINMYGAFHGLSSYLKYPFNLSKSASQRYRAAEVTYDGSTCLLFNNVDQARKEALSLAFTNKETKFLISGNQNDGVVSNIPFITKPKEIPSSTSKVTFEIDSGDVKMTFAACTPAKKLCGYAPRDIGAISDSNTKFCQDGEEIVEQKCCPDKKGEWGKWSTPGQNC